MSRFQRHLLGLAALATLLGGASIWALSDQSRVGSVLVRSGAMLGAVWFVAPSIRRPGRAGLIIMGMLAAVVIRPKLLIPALLALAIWGYTRRQGVPR